MASKWKKRLKKVGKVAALAAAAYGASRLGRKKPTVSSVGQDAEDINIGIRPGIFPPRSKKVTASPDFDWKTPMAMSAKGGRIGAKHGGHVKSMGVAKRGGGVAKR